MNTPLQVRGNGTAGGNTASRKVLVLELDSATLRARRLVNVPAETGA